MSTAICPLYISLTWRLKIPSKLIWQSYKFLYGNTILSHVMAIPCTFLSLIMFAPCTFLANVMSSPCIFLPLVMSAALPLYICGHFFIRWLNFNLVTRKHTDGHSEIWTYRGGSTQLKDESCLYFSVGVSGGQMKSCGILLICIASKCFHWLD